MTQFLRYFFAPEHAPWWTGNVWGNVVAVVPCGVLGFVWGRAVERRLHRKLDSTRELVAELHRLAHTGRPDPLAARRYPDNAPIDRSTRP